MRFFPRLALVGLCLTASSFASDTQPPVVFEAPLSPRIANYAIAVELEVERRMLHGHETLTWINKSPVAVEELQFHLYLNGFRNSQATFIAESGGRMRGASLDDDGWGFIEVDRIALVGPERIAEVPVHRYTSPHPGMLPLESPNRNLDSSEPAPGSKRSEGLGSFPLNRAEVDLTGTMEFIRPDDGNPHDLTAFRLPLPQALEPGEAVVLAIDFQAQLPTPPFARTGAKDEYFFVGQWFPKIAVHTGTEWNCHQFHYNSEFFADFGVYDVDITVPDDHLVGATGEEFERIDNGDGTATHRYHAEDVHDFAWTSSPDYVEYQTVADDVSVRVLMQRDNLKWAQVHLDTTVKAIQHFQATWGDYPFPNFTVVDPRRGAGGSGGMEYPTLVTAGSSRFEFPGITKLAIEAVIIHEFGHNYWYHLLASNEAEESWLDEGINTYTDGRTAADAFGSLRLLGMKIEEDSFGRLTLARPPADPIKTMSWKTMDRSSYSAISYSRPGVVLSTLRGYLGPERMNQVLRTYVERWRFRHPTTEDFIAVANDVSGENLDWFFDQALYGTEELDYSVTRITNEKLEERGYDLTRPVSDPWNGEGDFPVAESAGSETETTAGEETAEDEPTIYRSRVLVRRLGGFTFPVRLQVTFADGTVADERWDGRERWQRFEWTGKSRIVAATVDPEGEIALDRNLLNNGRTVETEEPLGVARLRGSIRFFAELLLDLVTL